MLKWTKILIILLFINIIKFHNKLLKIFDWSYMWFDIIIFNAVIVTDIENKIK